MPAGGSKAPRHRTGWCAQSCECASRSVIRVRASVERLPAQSLRRALEGRSPRLRALRARLPHGLRGAPPAPRPSADAVLESAPSIPLSRYVVNYKMRLKVAESYRNAKMLNLFEVSVQKFRSGSHDFLREKPTRPARRSRHDDEDAMRSSPYKHCAARNLIAHFDSRPRAKIFCSSVPCWCML
jgi:hypothetical protein